MLVADCGTRSEAGRSLFFPHAIGLGLGGSAVADATVFASLPATPPAPPPSLSAGAPLLLLLLLLLLLAAPMPVADPREVASDVETRGTPLLGCSSNGCVAARGTPAGALCSAAGGSSGTCSAGGMAGPVAGPRRGLTGGVVCVDISTEGECCSSSTLRSIGSVCEERSPRSCFSVASSGVSTSRNVVVDGLAPSTPPRASPCPPPSPPPETGSAAAEGAVGEVPPVALREEPLAAVMRAASAEAASTTDESSPEAAGGAVGEVGGELPLPPLPTVMPAVVAVAAIEICVGEVATLLPLLDSLLWRSLERSVNPLMPRRRARRAGPRPPPSARAASAVFILARAAHDIGTVAAPGAGGCAQRAGAS